MGWQEPVFLKRLEFFLFLQWKCFFLISRKINRSKRLVGCLLSPGVSFGTSSLPLPGLFLSLPQQGLSLSFHTQVIGPCWVSQFPTTTCFYRLPGHRAGWPLPTHTSGLHLKYISSMASPWPQSPLPPALPWHSQASVHDWKAPRASWAQTAFIQGIRSS